MTILVLYIIFILLNIDIQIMMVLMSHMKEKITADSCDLFYHISLRNIHIHFELYRLFNFVFILHPT